MSRGRNENFLYHCFSAKVFRLTAFCFLLFAFQFLCFDRAFSQTATATIDRDKMLLGEQITLELKAENINNQIAPIADWFSFPDTINHLEVVKRSPIDTLNINGLTSYTQNITLTAFDSGDWPLPPLFVTLQKGSDKDTLRTNDITIQVLPVDISNLKQYHDIKDIIDVQVKPNYWLVAGIVLFVLAGIGLLIWYFFLKNKKEKPSIKPVAALSLFESAIEQLEKLQKENAPAPVIYTRLDEICRTYFQNQLHVRALQLTTDELMIQLNKYLTADERTSFYQLLRLISAVKFAQYRPDGSAKTADINTAKTAIQQIYHHLQRGQSQHA